MNTERSWEWRLAPHLLLTALAVLVITSCGTGITPAAATSEGRSAATALVAPGNLVRDSAWVVKAPMPTRRNMFAAAVLKNRIYAVGGWTTTAGGEGPTGALEVYDPATDTWAVKAPMPTPRNVLAAAFLDGKLYAMGGWTGTEVTSKVEVYDPATNSWSAGVSMIGPRAALSAAVVGGRLYAIAGPAVEVYDPRHHAWAATASHNWVPRYFLGTAVLGGRIYAMGGAETPAALEVQQFYDTVQSYDPDTDTWTDEAPLRTGRNTMGAAVVGDTIFLVGGSNWESISPFLGMVESWRPGRGGWATRGPLQSGRSGLSVVSANGKVYALGGWDWDGASAKVEEYAYPSAVIALKDEGCIMWGNDFATPSWVQGTESLEIIPQALPGPVTATCRASGVLNGTGKWLVLRSEDHPGFGCIMLNEWLPVVPDWIEYVSPAGEALLVCWY